jgi:cyclic lactone autoinducer peptide
MKKRMAIIQWAGSILPALAMLLAVSSARQACFFWFHQPDVPASLIKKEE